MAAPAAKSSLPRGVVAPETGSVRMKKAPSMAPPEARWKTGEAKASGRTPHSRPAVTSRAAQKAAGMCQVMILR